jgi:bifunctional non-homologous end joining protein LigD
VAGRDVNLSNLDKVMYPEVGFTKGQVIDYWPVLNEKAIGDVRLEAIHVRYIRRCNCWKV